MNNVAILVVVDLALFGAVSAWVVRDESGKACDAQPLAFEDTWQ